MIELVSTNSRYLHRDTDGKELCVGELVCDTFAELAGVTEVGNVRLHFGSTAISADGEVCLLDSAGVWHKLSDGAEVT